MLEPISKLLNNLVDPKAGILSGVTNILAELTSTEQPITGALTELVNNLTGASTSEPENLGKLIDALNSIIAFLGSGDASDLDKVQNALNDLLNAQNASDTVNGILETTVDGVDQTISELLQGALGSNIEVVDLSELLDQTQLTSLLDQVITGVGDLLTGLLGGLGLDSTKLTDALFETLKDVLTGKEVVQNGLSHVTGELDKTVDGLLDNTTDLVAQLLGKLGLGGIATELLGPLTNDVLKPIIDEVLGLVRDGGSILLPPAPEDGEGNSTSGLVNVVADIVRDLTGSDTTLGPIGDLLDNLISNNGPVGDILASLNALTSEDGGALGILTELVKELYNAELPDGTNLEDLVLGLGGILNGLLDSVVKPIVGDLGSNIDQFIPNVLTLQLEHDTGFSKTDGITSDGTVLVKGLKEGQVWEYSIDGGNTWTTGTGNSFELAPNTYAQGKVWARVSSTGETQVNISTALQEVTIDQTHPSALTSAALANDTAVANDRISKDGTITVTGLESGEKLQYTTDAGVTWKTVTSGSSFALAEGTYTNGTVQVRKVDSAGNAGATTSLETIVIDKTAPKEPEIISFSPDGSTLYGHVDGEVAGTKVKVVVEGNLIGTGVTDANGNFAVALDDGKKYTDIDFTLQAEDIAGNASKFTDGNGPDGLITVVQNVLANLSDSTLIEPVSTLVNNLVDPDIGTLFGITGIVEALTATDQPLLGALTELVAGLTAAQNTGGAGTENLGPLINGLNTLIGFLGTADTAVLDDANQQLEGLLTGLTGQNVLEQILNPVEEGAQQLNDLLNGALGTNISLTDLDNLVNDGLLSGAVTGLTSTLNPLIAALNLPLSLLGLGNLLPSVTGIVNGLATAVDNLLSGEDAIQNGVAHQIGVLDDTVKSLITNDSLLTELTTVLGLNNLPLVSGLVNSLLNPIVNAVVGLISGDGILVDPAPTDGNQSTLGLLDVVSDIVTDLAGEGSLKPISTLVDNIIRNDGVTGDLLSAINGLTGVEGGQLGVLTELVKELYAAEQLPDNASLENLVQGLGGLLNGLLDEVVKPVVDELGGQLQLPDLSGANAFISGLGDEVFAGLKGSDTLIFKVLDDLSDAAGNGQDLWSDFTLGKIGDVADADKIDISNLLTGFDPTKTLADFVKVEQKDDNTVISIDRDGLSDAFNTVELLTLKNVNTTLDELLNNGQILV